MPDALHRMARLHHDAFRGYRLCLLADKFPARVQDADRLVCWYLLRNFTHPRRCLGPASCGLQPSSGLLILLLLPCVFDLVCLQSLSGSFRYCFPPAMAFRLQRSPLTDALPGFARQRRHRTHQRAWDLYTLLASETCTREIRGASEALRPSLGGGTGGW